MEWLHPSVSSRIIDDSVTFQTAQGGTVLFAVCPAEKGKDNELLPITSASEFDYNFGDLNLRKFGQTGYNVRQWVKNGGIAYVIRPLPIDARYSNAVLNVRTKDDDGTILLKHTKEIAEVEATSDLAFTTFVGAEVDDDDDGYAGHRILGLRATGRGEDYYNGLKFGLSINTAYDDTYTDFRIYDLAIYETSRAGANVLLDTLQVSLRRGAVDLSGESLFVEDVVAKYSDKMVAVFNEEEYLEVAELINPDVNPYLLDIITLIERESDVENGTETMTNAKIDDNTEVDYNFPIEMTGGLVGTANDAPLALANDYMGLVKEGYEGSLVPEVTNKKMYPFDMILGANYPTYVRSAINDFVRNTRQDLVFIDDTGLQANPQQEIDFRKSFRTSSFFISYFTNNAIVPFSSGSLKLTMTYFLAAKIPANDEKHGIHIPFVGPRRGDVSGFDKLAYNMTEFWEEQFYKNQLNTVVVDPKRTIFKTQLTSQTMTSVLSDISHVRALLRIRRDIEAAAENYQMEFINKATMSDMQTTFSSIVKEWVDNGALEKFSVEVYASAFDKKNKRVRVKIVLWFTAILERVVIDFVTK